MPAAKLRYVFNESDCLGLQSKMGGKFHLKLNIGTRPIANKYCEGKMKSTLKRELTGRETVKREAIEVSHSKVIRLRTRFCTFLVVVSIGFGCQRRGLGR